MLQTYDQRNEAIQIWIGDRLFPREEAKVSVFDSLVQGGDGVWEGLRVYEEGLFLLDAHLDRLQASARALAFQDIPEKSFILDAIMQTLRANGMKKDTHIRLSLSRGEKYTSGMDPRLNTKGSCLIVLAEWKKPVYGSEGIRLISSSIRRNSPEYLDSKIHHNNLLNNILAKIQANVAGVDAAIMLDDRGFISELNDTNIFFFKGKVLCTPRTTACLPGITRASIIDIAKSEGIKVKVSDYSLTELYSSNCAFATGTMSELVLINAVDGREISEDKCAEMLRIENRFREKRAEWCTALF